MAGTLSISNNMSNSSYKTRKVGVKKQVLDNKGVIDDIREHDISKSFALCNIFETSELLCNFCCAGGNINCRDSKTGETFLHVLSDYTHLYLTANGTRIMYMLSTKVDLDVTDSNGDTALHKVVRVPGAWRCIVALMRCGANPLIKNKAGHTPEEEILHLKNTGWQENLHWLRKYQPGLWAAVKAKNPDLSLIERLLRYWCRTVKIVGSETANLKCQVHLCETQLDLVCILEKYENSNELALSMLSGRAQLIDMWKSAENLQKLDVNTKDFSYQFYYRDYPTAPRPLLAAVWEIDQLELIHSFMELHPDTSVKYTFESEGASPPKPLFFQLVNPKSRPANEAITAYILRYADLNIRNIHGQTVLIEAMYNGETEGIIRAILRSGVNVAARDAKGRTARDHCEILKRIDYRQLIDSHVIELIQECDLERLEALVLHLYDHMTPNLTKCQIHNLSGHKCPKQLAELLKNVQSTQVCVRKLFTLVKSGNKTQLMKQMARKYGNARDKAGRTLLHFAIQHSHSQGYTAPSPNSTNSNSNKNGGVGNSDIILEDVNMTDTDTSNTVKHLDTIQLYSNQDKKTSMFGQIRSNCPFRKRACWRRCHGQANFTPDHPGIIKYLVQEFPQMLGVTNNLGQIPLHYAHIFSASKEVIDLLEQAGACTQIKDVFDFIPEDYDRHSCGNLTFHVRRQPTLDLDLDIFLTESNFEESFHHAVNAGDFEALKKLVTPLLEHGGEVRFSSVLFDCLDRGYIKMASFLVEAGFNTDISKQYEACDPDDPMCAMMECSHTVTTFRQRVMEVGATELIKLMDDVSTVQHQVS